MHTTSFVIIFMISAHFAKVHNDHWLVTGCTVGNLSCTLCGSRLGNMRPSGAPRHPHSTPVRVIAWSLWRGSFRPRDRGPEVQPKETASYEVSHLAWSTKPFTPTVSFNTSVWMTQSQEGHHLIQVPVIKPEVIPK